MRGGMSQVDTFDPKTKLLLEEEANQSKLKVMISCSLTNCQNWGSKPKTYPLFVPSPQKPEPTHRPAMLCIPDTGKGVE